METTMSNSGEEQKHSHPNPTTDNHQADHSQEWKTMAQAWLCAFPEAKATAVTETQVEAWIDSYHGFLPAELQFMPRSDLIDRLLSIQHYMRPLNQTEEKEASQVDLPPARFQRTDQWIPVYSWLESLDQDDVVKSKDISDWLAANPQVKEQLCSRHSRYHLMHYIKKCHLKILKRKEKKGLQQPNKETALKVHKDIVKPALTISSNPLINIPKDSDLYVTKRNEALRKYEILVELEKKLAPMFSKPQTATE